MVQRKLFFIRQVALTSVLLLAVFFTTHAQLVDQVIGQKRSKVQALLKPYRILDYKQEREVHNIEPGIHQTVLFENDTCKRFYWAVTPTGMPRFKVLLLDNGYQKTESGFAKDSLQLLSRGLESGKATLFIASLRIERSATAANAKAHHTRTKRELPSQSELQAMPLLQQAILEEEARGSSDSSSMKKKRTPKEQWVGGSVGQANLLGW